jgi:hypothetical protein
MIFHMISRLRYSPEQKCVCVCVCERERERERERQSFLRTITQNIRGWGTQGYYGGCALLTKTIAHHHK